MRFLLPLLLCACGGESGRFDGGRIHWSAEGSLSSTTDSAIIVVGEPGALADTAGSLLVRVDRSGTIFPGAIDAETGAFAAGVGARASDTLTLRYEESGHAITLDQPLAAVVAPDCTACGVDWSLVGAPVGGLVAVDLSVLDDPTPPFVVANVDGGAVIVADSVDEPVQIPAVSGGQVCAYQVVSGTPGPARCAVVP